MSIYRIPARAAGRLALGAALAFTCAQASAQSAADPGAAVPATRYEPAIRYRTEAVPAAPPDRNWIASNVAVTAGSPMAGHAAHAGHDAAAQTVPATDPHAGHTHHAGMAMPAAASAPQQCVSSKDGKDGKGGKDGGCCCAGMMAGAGHEHHAGMAMPAGSSGGCACCAGESGAAAPAHGAAS